MMRFSVVCITALLLSVASASRRHILQAATVATGGCQASPGIAPPECTGNVFSGNQWDKDELECHINEYQLKCDHNQEVFGSNTVRCNIDAGPLSSEIKFECPETQCVVMCDWRDVQGKVPGATFAPIQRILTAWKPREDIIG